MPDIFDIMISALTRFSRPHTIIATAIQVLALFYIAGGTLTLNNLGAILLTLAACLALNIYVVGLNQITDVEIDRINKPNLPLASAELSISQGRIIAAVMAFLAISLGLIAGPYLLATILIIMLIGTLYSLPPLRLKRFSLWAAISIALARGVFANLGVLLHYRTVFGDQFIFSPVGMAILILFFFGFGLVIAIYKDIPDLIGDNIYGIQSFTVQIGAQRAFNIGRFILTTVYLGVIIVASTRLPHPDALFLLASQVVALVLFWLVSSRIDPRQKGSMAHFYLFLWGLFYAQYIILSLTQVSKEFL